MSDYWEGEERPSGGDRDSVEIRTASQYYYLEGCECDTPQPWWNEEQHFFFIFITVFNKRRVVCLFFLPSGVWRRPECVPGSGLTERGRAAGQSSDGAKFYREGRFRHHLHSRQDCGIFALTRGKTEGREGFLTSLFWNVYTYLHTTVWFRRFSGCWSNLWHWLIMHSFSFSRSCIGTWSLVTFAILMTLDSQNASGYAILVLPNSSGLRTAYWWPPVTQQPSWLLRYGILIMTIKSCTDMNYWTDIKNTLFTLLKLFVCVCAGSEEAGLWCSLWHLEPGDPALHHDSWVSFSM